MPNAVYNKFFSHIYVETEARGYPLTKDILGRFADATVLPIDHYKDMFCKKNQNFVAQKNSPSLILAVKPNGFVHKGSPMCDDFGFEHFYYVTSIMNCLYNCEYCYLQGMYPSANVVIFVNSEDIIQEAETMLDGLHAYLCVSYDTDLLALESITGYTSLWASFARRHPNITIEVRTKSANYAQIKQALGAPADNIILAFTVSPEPIAAAFEHGVPSLAKRVAAANRALADGFRVRLCIDPILYVDGWQDIYGAFASYVSDQLPKSPRLSISTGAFRVSRPYFKTMRALRPCTKLFAYPFVLTDGHFSYAENISEEMIAFVRQKLEKLL